MPSPKAARLLTLILISLPLAPLGCQSWYAKPGTDSDGTPADFISAGRAASRFSVFQMDPPFEASAGPQVVASGDLDGDGLTDFVSGWNESQPVQIHLQRRDDDGDVYFETLPLGGTTPIALVADLEIVDMDGDGRNDVVVLVKSTGLVALCDARMSTCDPSQGGGVVEGAVSGGVIMFFAPESPAAEPWTALELQQTFFAGRDEGDSPEEGGYTDLATALIDGDPYPDLVVAFNSAEGEPQWNRVDFVHNPGLAQARQSSGWAPVTLYQDLPPVKSLALADLDGDIDVDVLVTYPDAASMNIRWLPNPLADFGPEFVPARWLPVAPVGQVDSGADIIRVADMDGDGINDVVVRSTVGQLIQWFKGPALPSLDFIRSPWQVYTIAEFLDRVPEGLAIGDVDGDGLSDVVASAEGALVWFKARSPERVYERWTESLIVDDSPGDSSGGGTTVQLNDNATAANANDNVATDPAAFPTTGNDGERTGTFMNAVIMADIDGDGLDDIVVSVDRNDLSGLTDDALVWFRNDRPSE